MKKTLILLLGILFFLHTQAQKKYDSTAILIIDRMSDIIGDLEACSFKLNTATDTWDPAYGLTKNFSDYEVYMSGQSKMVVNAYSYRGHHQFLYNGQKLAYYSYDENNYGTINTPNTIVKMVDSLHNLYDFDFPAGDFFYPAFTDDLLENCDSLLYLGIVKINKKEYLHVIAISKEVNFQFWVNNDAYNLPAKFAITYKNKPGSPQYLATFSEWQINPSLPSAMFNFQPPPGATEVKIISKNEK